MKISHAIIRNGISRGIPEGTKVPEKPTCKCIDCQQNWDDYESDLQAIWDASPEWEDHEAIRASLPMEAFKFEAGNKMVSVDGIYPLEGVNAEKVIQSRRNSSEAWRDDAGEDYPFAETGTFEYRTVLRLIPQPNSEPFKSNNEESNFISQHDRVEGTEVNEPTEEDYFRSNAANNKVGVDEKKEPETYEVTVDDIINFATWYSGMERSKVERQYKRYLRERGVSEAEPKLRQLSDLTEKEAYELGCYAFYKRYHEGDGWQHQFFYFSDIAKLVKAGFDVTEALR